MTKLYVDRIEKDGTSIMGATKDYHKIIHNIKQIDTQSFNFLINELAAHNVISFIEPIGKFICTVQLTLDDNSYQMIFLNFSKDYNKAIFYADILDNKEFGKKVISAYEATKKNNDDYFLSDEPLP